MRACDHECPYQRFFLLHETVNIVLELKLYIIKHMYQDFYHNYNYDRIFDNDSTMSDTVNDNNGI